MRKVNDLSYFSASKSRNGFYSHYRECFDRKEIDELYAIKGGPGTGKSRFIREVTDRGREKGWTCEMIYCSSDPDSLDGAILWRGERAVALLDATAPHVYEPTRPGFRENLVNLGEFWDASVLVLKKEEIERLGREKSEAYRRAYRYLSAFGEVMENRRELARPFIRLDALRRYAQRLLRDVENGSGFSCTPALMRSVGMNGVIGLDSYLSQAKNLYLIEDCRGSAEYLMRDLYDLCREKGLRVLLSHDPILLDVIDGLFLPDCGDAFVAWNGQSCPYPHRKVPLQRFVKTAEMRDVRARVNYAERLSDAMLGGALEELEEVKRAHFLLEEIYSSAMDFAKKEAYTKAFCDRLFQ